MTKRFVKFSSLFAVVAMLLGLMVTACSEGNNTPAEPEPESEGTVVKTTVGFETLGKFDCDASTKYLNVVIYGAEGDILADVDYADADTALAEEDVYPWVEKDENSVVMLTELDDADVALVPTTEYVVAYDKDENVLGYYEANIATNYDVDFSSDKYEFNPVSDLKATIACVSENMTEGVVEVGVEKTAEVYTALIVKDGEDYVEPLCGDVSGIVTMDYAKEEAKTYIELEKPTGKSETPWGVKGVAETTENQQVNVAYEQYGIKASTTFEVEVYATYALKVSFLDSSVVPGTGESIRMEYDYTPKGGIKITGSTEWKEPEGGWKVDSSVNSPVPVKDGDKVTMKFFRVDKDGKDVSKKEFEERTVAGHDENFVIDEWKTIE